MEIKKYQKLSVTALSIRKYRLRIAEFTALCNLCKSNCSFHGSVT